MATQGPSAPTSASQTATGGLVSWTSITNIETSGASYAVLPIALASVTSQTLMGEGFGFSIPGGATINGIVFTAYISNIGGNAYVNSVGLLKAGVAAGTAKTGTFYAGASSFGSSVDLWGTTWTPTDINNAGFGAAMKAVGSDYASNNPVNTNAWKITVYYTPAGSKSVAETVGLFGF